MNLDPGDPGDFDSLRKFMALKRYEQPPPGYFNRLPDKILDRIDRGEGQESFWGTFVNAFAIRPAMAYGFAMAAFSALTFSVIYSVKTQPNDVAQNPLRNGWRFGGAQEALAAQFNPAEPLHVANWNNWSNSNTSNAEAATLPSLFGSGPHDRSVPVLFASPP